MMYFRSFGRNTQINVKTYITLVEVIMHVPVLLNEVIDVFSSMAEKTDLIYFDGTFGRGGHYSELRKKYKIGKAYATDQDQAAINYASENFPEIKIFHENFYDFAQKNTNKIDMALLDLGVSSPQLDQSDRGFSFMREGPLDMRMNQNLNVTAADFVNTADESLLFKIFAEYGEVKKSAKVVRAILKDREMQKFETTLQLAKMIERVDGWQKKGFHPATQYFMGLRLVVNQELEVTEQAIPLLIDQLNDQGRLAVITFHSLEDRIVKNIFNESKLGFAVSKKVIVPTEEECKNNPRARSAKLRVFQKGLAAEKPDKFALRRMQRQ
jgi:16S rRNA (cytosine1402-N4)-methyltransferase